MRSTLRILLTLTVLVAGRPGRAAPARSGVVDECVALASFALKDGGDAAPFVLTMDYHVPWVPPRGVFVWQDRQRKALMLLDGRDNTPVLLVAANQGVVYDAMGQRVVSFNEAGINCEFTIRGDKLLNQFGATRPKASSPVNVEDKVDINFGALMDRTVRDRESRSLANGLTEFTGSSDRGNHIRVLINRSAVIPLQSFEMIPKNSDQPLLTVRINHAPRLPEVAFVSPWKRMADAELPVVPLTAATSQEAFGRLISSTMLIRSAIHSPGMRTEVKMYQGRKIDWEKIAAADARISRKLREIFLSGTKGLPAFIGKPPETISPTRRNR